jgi:hypothetical protein
VSTDQNDPRLAAGSEPGPYTILPADLAPTVANVFAEQLLQASLTLDEAANHHDREGTERYRRLRTGADDSAMAERTRNAALVHFVSAIVLRELAGAFMEVAGEVEEGAP